jgi:two-component system NarL family sensor kinase
MTSRTQRPRRLRPSILDDLRLGAALRQLAGDFAVASTLTVRADPGAVTGTGLAEADLALFRVAQESLRNTEVHAAATEVDLRLRRRGARVSLTVGDNGIGLAACSQMAGSGTGFLDMWERMRSVGGNLTVRSRPSVGTVVLATVPSSAPPRP